LPARIACALPASASRAASDRIRSASPAAVIRIRSASVDAVAMIPAPVRRWLRV
jgi:hypothetical protein